MATERLIAAVVIMAGVTVLTRALPFLLYKRRNPPKIILFAQRYIPPMVMLILVVHALGDASWRLPPHGVPELAAGGLDGGAPPVEAERPHQHLLGNGSVYGSGPDGRTDKALRELREDEHG